MAFPVTLMMIDSTIPTSLGNLQKEKSQHTNYWIESDIYLKHEFATGLEAIR